MFDLQFFCVTVIQRMPHDGGFSTAAICDGSWISFGPTIRNATGWIAYNITSDKDTGIGAWSDQQVFDYLSAGHAGGRGTAAGPMGEAVDKSCDDWTGVSAISPYATITGARGQ